MNRRCSRGRSFGFFEPGTGHSASAIWQTDQNSLLHKAADKLVKMQGETENRLVYGDTLMEAETENEDNSAY